MRGRRGFWNKVHKRLDGCWDWLGYFNRDGVGKFCTKRDGKPYRPTARRYAWEQSKGPPPAGHSLLWLVCWNPKCVNPAHGEPVLPADVTRWMSALGRPLRHGDCRGALGPNAKLTAEAVREIRAYRGVYGAMPVLARLYGISVHTARTVVRGRGWTGLRGRPQDRMPLRLLREVLAQRSAA